MVLVFRQSIENRSICKTSDLRIFNGGTTGDSFENVTLQSTKGFNTLDYVIVSHELINLFENLIAKELTFFSDDSLLICWASVSPMGSSQSQTQNINLKFTETVYLEPNL